MKVKTIVLISILLISIIEIQAKKDKVLITIGDNAITKSEFERIYKKNNTSAVYDNKSAEEYLELFINYKLKVIEAEKLGYDTVKSFIKELEGYRDKLIEPYLNDKDIYEQFINTGYERSVTEINASHIMIELGNEASYEDTAKVYQQMIEIRNEIINGKPFGEAAEEYSEDPSAKERGGNLGWFSAYRMVLDFENVAYNLPVGEISMPFRTIYGYHIIKVNGTRPSKGEILLAHILVRTPNRTKEEISEGSEKIYKYYEMLQNGEDFVDIVTKYSEDRSSFKNQGLLKWIKSGVLPDSLENVVFNLQNKGDYTEPLQSNYGWHIFRLHEKKPMGTLEDLRPALERRLKRPSMTRTIKKADVERLKKENNFVEFEDNITGISSIIDSSIYRGDRKLTYAGSMVEPIFRIGEREYRQKDLAEYISKGRYKTGQSIDYIIASKYDEFVQDKVFEYEKSVIDVKYPDLGQLLKEYHDGILLFNLTDDVVWSKAVKDTAGLEEFYEKNKPEKYMWKERADVSIYTFQDSSLAGKVKELALMRANNEISEEEMISELCAGDSIPCIKIEDNLYEENDNKLADKVIWEALNAEVFTADGKSQLVVINNILEPGYKLLSEIRGLVTADYQTFLEKKWVDELRNKYVINVDQKVLKKIK